MLKHMSRLHWSTNMLEHKTSHPKLRKTLVLEVQQHPHLKPQLPTPKTDNIKLTHFELLFIFPFFGFFIGLQLLKQWPCFFLRTFWKKMKKNTKVMYRSCSALLNCNVDTVQTKKLLIYFLFSFFLSFLFFFIFLSKCFFFFFFIFFKVNAVEYNHCNLWKFK